MHSLTDTDTDTDTAYMLRVCSPEMEAHSGFTWPESGPVEAPDWRDDDRCGGGLHGWLWGEGDASCSDYVDVEGARWLVCEIDLDEARDLGGKIKVPRCTVVHCGDRESATADIIARGARGAVIGATVTAGDRGTANAGYRGTATAGDRGTATAGYRGTATAGYRGTATAGYRGTATAGDRGTANAGYRGTATAGDGGELRIRWYDGRRYRTTIGHVGEDGIEAGVAYRCDSEGRLVRAVENGQ